MLNRKNLFVVGLLTGISLTGCQKKKDKSSDTKDTAKQTEQTEQSGDATQTTQTEVETNSSDVKSIEKIENSEDCDNKAGILVVFEKEVDDENKTQVVCEQEQTQQTTQTQQTQQTTQTQQTQSPDSIISFTGIEAGDECSNGGYKVLFTSGKLDYICLEDSVAQQQQQMQQNVQSEHDAIVHIDCGVDAKYSGTLVRDSVGRERILTSYSIASSTQQTQESDLSSCQYFANSNMETPFASGGEMVQIEDLDIGLISPVWSNGVDSDALPAVQGHSNYTPTRYDDLVLLSYPTSPLEVHSTVGKVSDESLSFDSSYPLWQNTFAADMVANKNSIGGPVFNEDGALVAVMVGDYRSTLGGQIDLNILQPINLELIEKPDMTLLSLVNSNCNSLITENDNGTINIDFQNELDTTLVLEADTGFAYSSCRYDFAAITPAGWGVKVTPNNQNLENLLLTKDDELMVDVKTSVINDSVASTLFGFATSTAQNTDNMILSGNAVEIVKGCGSTVTESNFEIISEVKMEAIIQQNISAAATATVTDMNLNIEFVKCSK